MLTVHHLEHSRSQRILWLLEELGVDYDVRRYERDPETSLAPQALEAVHPLGKSPVITDGDVTVAESGAIIEYLVEHYDKQQLAPAPGSAARREYTYWLHYAEGSFMPLMIVALILGRIETAPLPFFIRPVAKGIAAKVRDSYLDRNVERHLGFLDASLEGRDWFCGDALTAADIQMSFPLEAAEQRTDLRNRCPNLAGFLERSRARPAYRRALEKGGPFDLGSMRTGR
ncbi:MAG: glutathione S-transferase [Woeseiaceae bacterium]|nr:glutathione S-transferase [Woeseiaceae bacterium]